MKVLKENQIGNATTGSSLKGHIRCTYQELIKVLGEPTYPNPSGDNKVQKEWVIQFNGNVYTIYDWKTYDSDYTINILNEFHVGGTQYAGDLILELEKLVG